MRAGHRQHDAGKMPAGGTAKKQKDAPVVGKIGRETEMDDPMETDDADDPTEDMTEDAADGADGDDDPVAESPDANDKKSKKRKPTAK